MKHFEVEINQFIDNELNSEGQKKLFYHLSNCDECSILLVDYTEMKNETKNFYAKMSYESDNKSNLIIPIVKKNENYKYSFYLAVASAIILAFLLLFNLNSKDTYEAKYFALQTKLISLRDSYNTLLKNYNKNEVPKIESGTEKTKKVIKSNEWISSGKDEIQKKASQETNQKRKTISSENEFASLERGEPKYTYSKYIQSLPTEKITPDDFLTPQIAGN